MSGEEKQLPGPYEIFELTDREVKQLRITDYETGLVTIYPQDKPTGKVVTALRVHVPKETKDFFPFYWDITGKTLVAQLLPCLEQPGYKDKVFTITKYGIAPKARFTVEVKTV